MIHFQRELVTVLYKFLFIFVTFIFLHQGVSGQLFISPGPNVTPVDMVENIVGEGIIYDNVQFQGADPMRGIFTNGSTTNLGINSGIFLCSGSGYLIPGPNYQTAAGSNMGLGGHPSLNAITTATTYDAAVLSFDFVPESDTLRFKYVFGSEEYNEWVFSSFNDVFGYFVTGPNPAGGTYNDKNVAIVPGTSNTTVTINNVNNGYSPGGVPPTGPCTNCDYYADNTNGTTLEYDGNTTVLTAWLLVVPCETYSIKIGVADASDHIYDTGVFIKENSFESPKIEVETDPYPQGVSDNMIEGCVEADIIFKLPHAEYAPITVYFDLSESTANPAMYPPGDFEEAIPDSVVFEDGVDSVAIHVIPVKDGIIEGDEMLRLIIENTLGCIVRWDTVDFLITDYIDMVDTIMPQTVICQGQEIDIWLNAFNGIPPYTFEWEGLPDETNDTITVAPEVTTTYVVQVFDMCLDSIADSTTVIVFPLPEVELGGDTGYICNNDTLLLNAGSGFLGYFWQDGSTDSTYSVTSEGLYYVTVFGPGGCSNIDSIYVTNTIFSVDLGEDSLNICIGDTAIFNAGAGYNSYLWQDGQTGQIYYATETGWYSVDVTMSGCTATDSAYLYVWDPNLGVNLGQDITKCIESEVTLSPQLGIYNSYLWSTGETTMSITVSEPGTYTLEVEGDCGTATDQITIQNYPYPDPGLGPDQFLCNGQTAFFQVNFPTVTWQDNSTGQFYTASETGVYYCDVLSNQGCMGTDTVYIEIANVVNLADDSLILCTGETITLDAGQGFHNYDWSSGQITQSIEVQTGGTYTIYTSYSYGCPSQDSVVIDEFPIPVAKISGPESLCTGETIMLSAQNGPFEYYWNGIQSDDTTYMVSGEENVNLKVTNVCGEDTDEFMVVEYPLPNVTLGPDVLLFPDESVVLDAGEYQTYVWSGPGIEDGQYYTVQYADFTSNDSVLVEVFDGFCKNNDGIRIEAFTVKVPTAMTPNGDGSNERFEPIEELTGLNEHTMMVFNRWGEKVWESTDFAAGWDGKQNGKFVADGTYFWVLEVYYGPDNAKKVYKGTLTVLGAN